MTNSIKTGPSEYSPITLHTPERLKRGLGLSDVGDVALPQVNVKNGHQTALKQLDFGKNLSV